MVKSNKLYSPQQYLEAVTGKCYIVDGDDDVLFIDRKIQEFIEQMELENPCDWQGITFLNYPLVEIDHIVEVEVDVVLVDCMVWNDGTKEFEHEYRWFEVPEDFEEETE